MQHASNLGIPNNSRTQLEPGGSSGTLLVEDLHARMKAEIVTLRLEPGLQLQEVALGQRFGVSRTPVREVLQRLQREGLVERFGRFYRVVRLTEDEVRELCELREALECMATSLAVRRRPACVADLAALVDAQERALSGREEEAVNRLDGEFHMCIAAAAGNEALRGQIAMLNDRAGLIRGMEGGRPLWTSRLIAEHRRIVDAMERGDAEIAAAEMRYHIRSVVALRPA